MGELSEKLTAVPSITGSLLLSVTVAVTVVVPSTVTEDGFTAILMFAGGGAVMVIVTEFVRMPDPVFAVAVTVIVVGTFPAVNTTWVTPLALVVPVSLPSAASALLKLYMTESPETGLPVPSTMVVDIVVVPLVCMEDALAVIDIDPNPVAWVMVMVVKFVKVADVAVTVTAPALLPAVNVTCATPLPSVNTVSADNVPAVLFTEKLTVAPEMGIPPLSVMVADTVVLPLVVKEVEPADIAMAPPAIPPVMVTSMEPVTVSDNAPMVTVPLAVAEAVNVAIAVPFDVKALVVIVPLVGSSRANTTRVPSTTGFPVASTTVAVIVDVPDTGTELGLAIMEIAEVAEAIIEIVTDPLNPPDVAVMVISPVLFPAVK